MIDKYLLPLFAGGLVLFAIAHTISVQRPVPELSPPVPPPVSPFGNVVAGAGMVEAASEASGTGNIAIGSQLSGIVEKVCVRLGETVRAGDVLFELDKRQADAELRVREAAESAAEKQLRQLELRPRLEEVPPSEAQVDVATANLRQQQDLYERGKKLVGTGAITAEDFITLEEGYRSALAQLALAKANLALLKAGTWEPDKAISRANIDSTKAQVEQAKTTLDLLRVCAPVDGTILQVNVRPGEYISTLGGQSLILMGSLQPLHVRVNVDEEDIPRLRLSVPARAKLRGDVQQEEVPLTFVRLEPYVVPKVSLTGNNVESR